MADTGFSGGVSLATQDYERRAQAAHHLSNVAAMPGQMRLTDAKAREQELENEAKASFARLMQQSAGGPQMDLPTALDDLATRAMRAGLPDKALEIAKGTSQIRAHQATQRSEQAQQDEREFKLQSDRVSMLLNIMSGVRDQPSFDRAQTVWEQTTQQPSPYRGVPYSPELVQEISSAALKTKERLELGIRERTLKSLEENRAGLEQERQTRQSLMRQRERESKAREKKLEKAGGSTKPSFTKDSKFAESLIAKDWQDIPLAEAKIFAQQVAERSDEIQKENPGLVSSQATSRAYEELKKSGVFYGLTPNIQRPGAASFNVPKPMPTDKKALVRDQVYDTPMGRGRWNGSEFEKVK